MSMRNIDLWFSFEIHVFNSGEVNFIFLLSTIILLPHLRNLCLAQGLEDILLFSSEMLFLTRTFKSITMTFFGLCFFFLLFLDFSSLIMTCLGVIFFAFILLSFARVLGSIS